MTITAFGVTLPHAADYWSNGFRIDGGYNFIPYSSAEFDRIVAATQSEGDPEKFRALVDEGIELPDEEVPMIIFGTCVGNDGWHD